MDEGSRHIVKLVMESASGEFSTVELWETSAFAKSDSRLQSTYGDAHFGQPEAVSGVNRRRKSQGGICRR